MSRGDATSAHWAAQAVEQVAGAVEDFVGICRLKAPGDQTIHSVRRGKEPARAELVVSNDRCKLEDIAEDHLGKIGKQLVKELRKRDV